MSHCTAIALILGIGFIANRLAAPHTPQPGSEERKAICDGVRSHVLSKVAMKKPPMKVVFKIEHLNVEGETAWFEGTPRQENGSYLPDGYLPDVDYCMVVQRAKSGWKVIEDLSRTDVPGDEEVVQLKKRLKDVPSSIMPQFWRELLKR